MIPHTLVKSQSAILSRLTLLFTLILSDALFVSTVSPSHNVYDNQADMSLQMASIIQSVEVDGRHPLSAAPLDLPHWVTDLSSDSNDLQTMPSISAASLPSSIPASCINSTIDGINADTPPGFDGTYRLTALITIPKEEYARNPLYAGQLDLADGFIMGYKFWRNKVNRERSFIFQGKVLFVNLSIVNIGFPATKADVLFMAKQITDVINCANGNPRPHAILGPWTSAVTEAVLKFTNPQALITVAPGAGSDFVFQCFPDMWPSPDCAGKPYRSRRFKYAYALLHPLSRVYDNILNTLAVKGVRNIAIAYEYIDPAEIAAWKGVKEYALSLSMNVLDIPIPRPLNDTAVDKMIDSIEAFRIANQLDMIPPLFGNILNPADCTEFTKRLRARNYSPSFLGFNSCSNLREFTSGDFALYTTGYVPWSHNVRGSMYSDSVGPWQVDSGSIASSAQVFADEWKNITINAELNPKGDDITKMTESALAASAAAGVVYQKAWANVQLSVDQQVKMNSSDWSSLLYDSELLRTTINSLDEPSFYGMMTYDVYGHIRYSDIPSVQITENGDGILPGKNKIIAPIASMQAELIFPMPRWDERVYTHRMYARASEQSVIVVSALLTFFTLLLGVYFVHHRNHPVAKADSVNFSCVVIFSSIIAFLAPITWMLEDNASTCAARPWLFTMGFCLPLSPILSKTLRVAWLFSRSKITVLKLRDSQLFAFVGVLLLPQIVITIVWTARYPLTPTVSSPDPLRPSLSYTMCSSQNDPNYTLAWVSLGYSCILLFMACVLSFFSRKAFSLFNDSKSLAASTYLLTVLLVLIALIQTNVTVESDRTLVFLIRSYGIYLAFVSMLLILYAPKVVSIYYGEKALPVMMERKNSFSKNSISTNGAIMMNQMNVTAPPPHRSSDSPMAIKKPMFFGAASSSVSSPAKHCDRLTPTSKSKNLSPRNPNPAISTPHLTEPIIPMFNKNQSSGNGEGVEELKRLLREERIRVGELEARLAEAYAHRNRFENTCTQVPELSSIELNESIDNGIQPK